MNADFRLNYHTCDDPALNETLVEDPLLEPEILNCEPASSLLFLLLMFGTVWVGISLFNFNKT